MAATKNLITNLKSLQTDTAQLETRIDYVYCILDGFCEKLKKSKEIKESLDKLDSQLDTASGLLGVVRLVPAISVSASNAKRVIDVYRKPVSKAAKEAANAEKKIKPVREKLKTICNYVGNVDNQFRDANNTELRLHDAVNQAKNCVESLPSGVIRQQSAVNLDNVCAKASPLVGSAEAKQASVLNGIEQLEGLVEKFEKRIKALVDIDKAIDQAMKKLKPFIAALKAIQKSFSVVIRIPFGGYPKMCKKTVWPGAKVLYPCGWKTVYFSFSIQAILDGVNDIAKPVMDLLDKAMGLVLNPLLKALNLNIKLPAIPGLDKLKKILQDIFNIAAPIEKAIERLRREVDLLQQQFEKLFAYLDPLEKMYDDCINYQGADEEMELKSKKDLDDLDPELFDAMCFKGRTVFIFRGKYFWQFTAGSTKEAEPVLIQGQWGIGSDGKPIKGPFDAACYTNGTFYFFRGNSYWTFGNDKGKGPMQIKGRWGTDAKNKAIIGRFQAVCPLDRKLVLFKGKQFWITSPATKKAQGPFPIAGIWGKNKANRPLTGPFDAVTIKGQKVLIRKGKNTWEQSLRTVRKNLAGKIAPQTGIKTNKKKKRKK